MVTWNLNHIAQLKDTEHLLTDIKNRVERFQRHRESLNGQMTPAALLAIIKELEEINDVSSRVSGFADLWQTENTSDPVRNAHVAHIHDTLADQGNRLVFFSIWFKGLPDKTAQRLISGAGDYQYYLERIRLFKDHTLNEKEEQIVNLLNVAGVDTVTNLYDIVTNRFQFTWNGKQVTQSDVTKLYADPSPAIREQAYRTILPRYEQEEPILGELYAATARAWRNEYMKLRGYATPISVRNLSNHIPDKAIQAMMNVIKRQHGLFQEYFRLKFKLLKCPATRFHLYAPLPHPEKKYPYDISKSTCLTAYKSFDPAMETMARQMFTEDHVHSDPAPGKRSGAFCATILPTITPYLMLNHTGTINDLFTMMHELGHGIHSISSRHHSSFVNHPPIPLAETASIFGELILLKSMLASATKEEKIYLLAKEIDKQYASIMRQASFVLFEEAAHQKIAQGATTTELNALYLANLQEQFGTAVAVDPLFSHEWKYIPHIYHTPFYCYGYAFGNLLVLALYRMYEREGPSFSKKYLRLLGHGGSMAPERMLQELGIDMASEAFWEQGFAIIREDLELLQQLLRKQ